MTLPAPAKGGGELRIMFPGQRWSEDAREIAAVVRKVLKRAFPSAKFVVRYRTTRAHVDPSWISIVWRGAVSEANIEGAVKAPLSEWRAASKARLEANPLWMLPIRWP